MASYDLEIIEKIEKALRRWLRPTDYVDRHCYLINKQGQVITLRLRAADLTNANTDFSFLKELVHLQTLDLSYNQITDISFLKDIRQLQTINLWDNQISILPQWITELSPDLDYYSFSVTDHRVSLKNTGTWHRNWIHCEQLIFSAGESFDRPVPS